MARVLFEAFRYIVVFLVILVNNVFYTLKSSLEYILFGENAGLRLGFILIYAMYGLSYIHVKVVFLIINLIWLYCEVFLSVKTVNEIYNSQKN